MSEYQKFAKEVDDMAKGAFAEYLTAEATYKAAQKKFSNTPVRMGSPEYEMAVKEYNQAKVAYQKARIDLDRHIDDTKKIRNELSDALAKNKALNLEEVDDKTLHALSNGILDASDMRRLLDEHAESPSYRKVIGRYADKAQAEASKHNDPDKAREYRMLAHDCQDTGNETLSKFDALTDVFSRCTRNTGMIGQWSDLTGKFIDEF